VTEVPDVTTPDPVPDLAAAGRRSFRAALALLAAGAGLLLLASGRIWSTTVAGGGDLPTVTVDLTGSDLIAGGAVALLVLAGIAGLLATRRVGRVVVGVLLVLAGLGVVFFAGRFGATWSSSLGDGDTIQGLVFDRVGTVAPLSTTVTPWWVAALLAGVLVMAGGALAIATSRSWPEMGRRYERRDGADAPERDARPRSAWDQLDEGIDPTEEPPPTPSGDTTADPTLGVGGDA